MINPIGDTRVILERVVQPSGRPSSWAAVADILAARLPVDVARALEAAELTHARYQPVLANSQPQVYLPRLGHAMGIGWLSAAVAASLNAPGAVVSLCEIWLSLALFFGPSPVVSFAARALDVGLPPRKLGLLEYGGEVRPEDGTFDVSAPVFASPLERAGLFTHESMHVLDFACAKAGMTCSMEPEFRAIADAMRAGKSAWPSALARENDLELFAEAGTAYLGLPKRGCMDKEALRTKCPELFAYFERFFTERLPQVLASGELTKAGAWKAIRETDAYEPGARARYVALEAVRHAQRLAREGAPDDARRDGPVLRSRRNIVSSRADDVLWVLR